MFKKKNKKCENEEKWDSSKLLDYVKGKTEFLFIWLYLLAFTLMFVYEVTNLDKILGKDLIGILLKLVCLLFFISTLIAAQCTIRFNLKKDVNTFMFYHNMIIFLIKLLTIFMTTIVIAVLCKACSKFI